MLSKVYKGFWLFSLVFLFSIINIIVSFAETRYTNDNSQVFMDSNSESEVLLDLESGVEIETISNNGSFTYIKVGDINGYIETSNIANTVTICEYDTDDSNVVESSSGTSLGYFRLTSFCGCSRCNGKWTGYPGAYGLPLTENRTVAVDPRVIPLGSWIEINVPGKGWQKFRAEDTGSGVKGNHIDVYIGTNHSNCYNPYYNTNGARSVEVRLIK